MARINTVIIKGVAYGFLVITGTDSSDVNVYAIPIEEFEQLELTRYRGVPIQELPLKIRAGIEMDRYMSIEVANAYQY